MKRKILLAVLLVISFSAGSYGSDVFGREYVDVALNPPPEDAIEIGREYLQELVDLHFEEDVAIGEPTTLLAPDLTIWAYSYPATLGTTVSLDLEGTLDLYDEWCTADQATLCYASDLLACNVSNWDKDDEYVRLRELCTDKLLAMLKNQFLVVAFSNDKPTLVSFHKTLVLGVTREEEFKDCYEVRVGAGFVGYSFLPDIYDPIELVAIFQDNEGIYFAPNIDQTRFDSRLNAYPAIPVEDCLEGVFGEYESRIRTKQEYNNIENTN